jgi:hypothetical protein
MVLAYTIICAAYMRHGTQPCVITSACDGTHSINSLHYTGYALDLRTKSVIPAMLSLIVRDIKRDLGEQFDVVEEEDHLHVEFDPKEHNKEA